MRRLILLIALLPLMQLRAEDLYIPPVLKSVGGTTRVGIRPIRPPRAEQWRHVTTSRFDVWSSADDATTQQAVRRLESIANTLAQVDPRFVAKTEPQLVMIFGARSDAQSLFDFFLADDDSRAPGMFVDARAGGMMVIDAGAPWMRDRTIAHELVHDLLSRSGSRLPLWAEEGLSDFFSTIAVEDGKATVGAPIMDYQRLLQRRGAPDFESLVAKEKGADVINSTDFYAASWSLVDAMLRLDRTAFSALLSDLEKDRPAGEAIRARYGVEPSKLVAKASADRGTAWTLPAPEFALPASSPASRDAATLRLAAFLGRFDAPRKDAMRMTEEILSRSPDDIDALATKAIILNADKKWEDAEKLIDRVVIAAPDNAEVLTLAAELRLRSQLGTFAGIDEVTDDDAPRFKRARELAAQAERIGRRSPRTAAVLGIAAMTESDPAPGVAPLRFAVEQRPRRHDYALALYTLLLRTDRAEAQRFFDTALAPNRDPQLAMNAGTIRLRELLTAANRFIRVGKAAEAVPLLKEIADATSDAFVKADIQRQIASVEKLAHENRQITTYNSAISLVNRGDRKGAKQVLEQLLKWADDPEVVRNSRKLLKEIS